MISKAIESVKSQRFENWELIIVDDGSTDNTKELIENYINDDKELNIFFKKIVRDQQQGITEFLNQMVIGFVF